MSTSKFLLLDDAGGLSPLSDAGPVQAGIASLMAMCQSRVDGQGRRVYNTHAVSLSLIGRRIDSAHQAAVAEMRQERGDAFTPSLGMFNPRDLTHRMRQVLEEKHQPLLGMQTFPVNTDVPPGALAYEQYRMYGTGEAVVYRGGTGADVPAVGIGQASFQHPVVYVVSKAAINWLEQLAANYAGLNTQERKLRYARLAIEQLVDEWIWKGSTAHGLFGLLNHPYVDTAVSLVNAATGGDSNDDIASDFAYWANYSYNESGAAFQPDTLLIAPKLATDWRNRKYADDASKSLMDWLLNANPHIKNVREVPKLNDALGSGIHAMSFVRSGSGIADSSCEIVMPMDLTMLPPEQRALVTELFMVAGYGGLNQKSTGDNLTVYIQGNP